MSHLSKVARARPDAVAAIFPGSGQALSFADLDAAANRAAHAMRAIGLRRGDCIALSITNRPEWLAAVLGAQRIGLYYVLLSTKMSADDLAYVVADSQAQALVISDGCFALTAETSLRGLSAPVFGLDLALDGVADWASLTAGQPATLPDQPSCGAVMLYSSGTTGRPKGVRKPLPDRAFDAADPATVGVARGYGLGEGSVLYSPSPLYHAAPHRYVTAALHSGATVVLPERFDAGEALVDLQAHQCTHGLWVPTMFHRMLRLPASVRQAADLSSQRYAIHGAAPCPQHVKRAMIDWWGPILDEYYSGSEGVGFVRISSQEWLAHPGSVGRAANAHVLGPDGGVLPAGAVGDIYFSGDNGFEYWRDPAKTAGAQSPQGWRTYGDIGYLDVDGYLYLTDRRHFTIISGGVNIYPQEIEAVLLEHPSVRDAAVIGAPSEDLGQAAMAVVELVSGVAADASTAEALLGFVRARLGPVKTPKRLVFEAELPRHDTGKLFKQDLLRKFAPPLGSGFG